MSSDHIRDVAARRGVSEDALIRALNKIKAQHRGDDPPSSPPKRSVVFGTDTSCDVRITDDPYVSNRHCAIHELTDGSVVVEDLGSTNGTTVRRAGQSWMSGSRVYSRTPIEPGMVVRIGHTDLPWQRTS